MGVTPAQTMYDAIKADRLDPENAQVTRVVGGGGGATASQLPATLGVKTQALSLSTGLAQDKNVWAQLTAPGATAAFSTVGYKRITAAYTVAAINTNVVLRLEGSMDGTNWFNLSSTNTDTTVTANGTNAFNVEAAVDQVRLNFVSESGGTAATIDATVRVSS
jgi:hypothetical protein